MCGRLTFTTDVSSSCITAHDITAMAVIQRCGEIDWLSNEERVGVDRGLSAAARGAAFGVAPSRRGMVRLATIGNPVPHEKQIVPGRSRRSESIGRINGGNALCSHSQTSALSRRLSGERGPNQPIQNWSKIDPSLLERRLERYPAAPSRRHGPHAAARHDR